MRQEKLEKVEKEIEKLAEERLNQLKYLQADFTERSLKKKKNRL